MSSRHKRKIPRPPDREFLRYRHFRPIGEPFRDAGLRMSKPVRGAKSAEGRGPPAATPLHAGAIEVRAAARAHLRLLPGKAADDAVGVRDRGGAEPKRVAHAGRTLCRRRLILGEGARHRANEAGDSEGDYEAAANRGHDSLHYVSVLRSAAVAHVAGAHCRRTTGRTVTGVT